MCARDFRVSIH